MKDYSKVKYVKPSVDGNDITKGKVYKVYRSNSWSLPCIKDDRLDELAIRIVENSLVCHHLKKLGYWIPCDKDGNEIEI